MDRQHFEFENVLVGGRRLSGSATGKDAAEALRRFVAKRARELGVDVTYAINQAATAKGFRVKKRDPEVASKVDQLLPDPEDDYTEWPAMRRKPGLSQ
jgi:ribosomal protein L31E